MFSNVYSIKASSCDIIEVVESIITSIYAFSSQNHNYSDINVLGYGSTSNSEELCGAAGGQVWSMKVGTYHHIMGKVLPCDGGYVGIMNQRASHESTVYESNPGPLLHENGYIQWWLTY